MYLSERNGMLISQEVLVRRNSTDIYVISTAFLVAAALWCSGAKAEILVHFDLPAQSLARSLTAIGSATNTSIGFSASQVAGLFAPSLKADLTVDGALMRVLAGTGLRLQHLDDRSIVIAATESSLSNQPDVTLLPVSAFAPAEQTADSTRVGNAADNTVPLRLAQSDASARENTTNSVDDGSQNAADQLEEVVVTGTHIRGIENKTSPVIVIDRDQIDRSGYSSTQDLFRSLPQNFSSGDASEDGRFGTNPNSGINTEIASGINLRGLGVSSTLVLLNGHRLAPSAFGTIVDVSLIPLSAIDRIEILTDGASAIYGSDAVGGVVNIILRKDYSGAETAVHYGSVTDGSRHEEQVAQTYGTNWSGGNVVATLQYEDKTPLPARDREFASSLPSPNDLLPEARTYAATFNARQSLSNRLELYGDMLLSDRYFDQGTSINEGAGLGDYVTYISGKTDDVSFTPGMRYEISSQWSAELDLLYSKQQSTAFTASGPPAQTIANDNRFTEKSADLLVTGKLSATQAGEAGLALGMSYRTDNFDATGVIDPGSTMVADERRNVAAGFAEFYLPLVGKANRMPLVEALEFSAAVRRDRYSDFGSTTNPRFGVRWNPWNTISLRASYGTSFRAPNTYEEFKESPDQQSIYTFPFANPAGPGTVPVLVPAGSTALQPETARTEDFGIEYKPSGIDGLTVTLNYYGVRYTNRIITPPFDTNALLTPQLYGGLISPVASNAAAQAIIDATVAAGGQYYDFAGTGPAGVRYLYDFRQQNAAVVRQSGFDFTPKFTRAIGEHTLSAQLNLSFIDQIKTAFAAGGLFDNLVNTLGNPVKWRGRFDATWAGNRWAIGGALNGVGHYVNPSGVGAPPIGSWTTLDVNATIYPYAYWQGPVWRGTSLSIAALNVLNREPPYVSAPALLPVNYDPANANPLDRFVGIYIKKKW
jgi:iron complex outermembrane recepter protein